MQWFTETAGPPIMIALVLATVCFLAWYPNRRGIWFLAGCACLTAGAVIYGMEAAIVTEAEQIEQRVYDLGQFLKDGPPDKVLEIISEEPPTQNIRQFVAAQLTHLDVTELRITDLTASVNEAETVGKSRFRANGSVVLLGSHMAGTGPTMWELDWQRESDGQWRITNIHRLNPRTGEEVEFLSRF